MISFTGLRVVDIIVWMELLLLLGVADSVDATVGFRLFVSPARPKTVEDNCGPKHPVTWSTNNHFW